MSVYSAGRRLSLDSMPMKRCRVFSIQLCLFSMEAIRLFRLLLVYLLMGSIWPLRLGAFFFSAFDVAVANHRLLHSLPATQARHTPALSPCRSSCTTGWPDLLHLATLFRNHGDDGEEMIPLKKPVAMSTNFTTIRSKGSS